MLCGLTLQLTHSGGKNFLLCSFSTGGKETNISLFQMATAPGQNEQDQGLSGGLTGTMAVAEEALWYVSRAACALTREAAPAQMHKRENPVGSIVVTCLPLGQGEQGTLTDSLPCG